MIEQPPETLRNLKEEYIKEMAKTSITLFHSPKVDRLIAQILELSQLERIALFKGIQTVPLNPKEVNEKETNHD